VNLVRKGIPLVEGGETVEDYTHWRVVENGVALLKAGLAEMVRWKVSFWERLDSRRSPSGRCFDRLE
jgi:hypothetical protein